MKPLPSSKITPGQFHSHTNPSHWIILKQDPGLLSFHYEYLGNLNIRDPFSQLSSPHPATVCLNLDPKCTDIEDGRNLFVIESNLNPLTGRQWDHSIDMGSWRRKPQGLSQVPSKVSRQLVLKTRAPRWPSGKSGFHLFVFWYWGKDFKDRVREGGFRMCTLYPDQVVDILLTGWWWGSQESTSLTLWF